MDEKRLDELKRVSAEVRKDILRMVGIARSGPYETAIAAANILVYLYWEELLIIPSEPRRADRDRLVTDITAAIPALYAVLARRGFFEREHLWHYRRLGAMLQALPDYGRTPGIDAPCLLLQPSSAMAAAMAEELYSEKNMPHVFFLTLERSFQSDKFVAEMRRIGSLILPNLIAVIMSRDDKDIHAAEDKNIKLLKSFGWDVCRALSDDFNSLETAFKSFDFRTSAPKALFVLADAEPGFTLSDLGKSAAERSLRMDELDHALEELEVKLNEHQ